MSVTSGRKTTENRSALAAQKASRQHLAGIIKSSKLPPGAVAEWFLSLYPNRIKAILRTPGCKDWTTVSKHWPISDETIASAIAGKENRVWGLRWGQQTQFAVLDIDAGSKYHSKNEIEKLQVKLSAVGLMGTLYRSSYSGGWHLYIFLEEWTASEEIHDTLKAWLIANNYEIGRGTLEIFPSNMGLRLPLQAGFAWLNDEAELVKCREDLTPDDAISRFVTDAQQLANNWHEARIQIVSQLSAARERRPGSAQEREKRLSITDLDHVFNYGLIPEKYQEGRQYWQNGLTTSGLRHDAILAIGHYLWHGDDAGDVPAMPGRQYDEARYRLILAWLEKKHNGYCRHINRGKWSKVEAEIRRAVKWRRASTAAPVRIPYALTENSLEVLIARYKSTGRIWTMEDLEKGNDRREVEARNRIREAFHLLVAQGRRVTVRQLKRLAKCHYATLQKNKDIWSISLEMSLSRVAGDCSSYIGGSVSSFESLDSETDPVICAFVECSNPDSISNSAIDPLLEPVEERNNFPLTEINSLFVEAAVERAEPRISFSVFESLRLKLFGATANNSTASKKLSLVPSLASSLATGSNTGAPKRCMWVKPGVNGLLLKRFPPRDAGPLHLPQTGFLLVAQARARNFAPGLRTIFHMAPYALFWISTDYLDGAARNCRRLEQVSFYGRLGHQSNRKWGKEAVRGPPGGSSALIV